MSERDSTCSMAPQNRDTEDRRGNKVAKAVWAWLQEQKAIQYVPWVVNPESDNYDPAKAKEQEQRDKILGDLERVIMDAVSSR